MFIVPDRGESGAHQLCPLGHAMSGCCLELLFLGQTFVNTIIYAKDREHLISGNRDAYIEMQLKYQRYYQVGLGMPVLTDRAIAKSKSKYRSRSKSTSNHRSRSRSNRKSVSNRKVCGDGEERSERTGRCIKRCTSLQTRNPASGRCKKH